MKYASLSVGLVPDPTLGPMMSEIRGQISLLMPRILAETHLYPVLHCDGKKSHIPFFCDDTRNSWCDGKSLHSGLLPLHSTLLLNFPDGKHAHYSECTYPLLSEWTHTCPLHKRTEPVIHQVWCLPNCPYHECKHTHLSSSELPRWQMASPCLLNEVTGQTCVVLCTTGQKQTPISCVFFFFQ